MDRDQYYRLMFYASAIWNWTATLTFLFGESMVRSITGATIAFDPMSKQLFCGCVLAFGIGYWIVARDISRNRGIVWIGIIGKLMVVVVFFGHAIAGTVPYAFAAPTIIDVVFVGLFAEFLANHPQSA